MFFFRPSQGYTGLASWGGGVFRVRAILVRFAASSLFSLLVVGLGFYADLAGAVCFLGLSVVFTHWRFIILVWSDEFFLPPLFDVVCYSLGPRVPRPSSILNAGHVLE